MFVEATDLRRQYDRYYRIEYNSLSSFLDIVHDLRLEPGELEKSHLMLVEEASGVADEVYDDNQLKVILECIRRLEDRNEN